MIAAVLAQAELGALETLARQGGPFAIAFGMLTVCGLVLWQYALKPAFTSLGAMHTESARCSAQLAESTRASQVAAEANTRAAEAARETTEINARMMEKLLERIK